MSQKITRNSYIKSKFPDKEPAEEMAGYDDACRND